MSRTVVLEEALKRLDPEQALAAAWDPKDGNLRIVASAGSGKTTVLTTLAARLVADGVVAANRLVLTTFANRASKTLKMRLHKMLPPMQADAIRATTFHGLALSVLRSRAQSQWSMERCLDASAKTRGQLPSSFVLWRSVTEYGQVPGTGVKSLRCAKTAEDVQLYVRACGVARAYGCNDYAALNERYPALAKSAPEDFEEAWDMVLAAKAALSAWDFDDSLQGYLAALQEGADAADVVLVDEAMDNSKIQLDIAVKLAANAEGKLILVGDLAQNVHKWRGAYPELFANADKTIGAKTMAIATNYRSLPDIVDLGNRIVEGRSWKLGPPARSFRAGAADPAVIQGLQAVEVEDEIAGQIARAVAKGAVAGAFAILTRTNAQLSPFQGALAANDIPYTLVGGESLFESKEAQTVLSYLLLSERDAYGAVERILHVPKRYLGVKFVDALRVQRNAGVGSLVAAIRSETRNLAPGQRHGAFDLAQDIEMLRAERNRGWEYAIDAVEKMIEKKPEKNNKKAKELKDKIGESPDEDKPALYKSAVRVARRRTDASDLLSFAQHILNLSAQASDDDALDGGGSRVLLSTVHKFKGGQSDVVYSYVEAGTFPSSRSSAAEMEDELRLFYVLCTRPKNRLVLAYREQPSEFALRYCASVLRRDCGFIAAAPRAK
jgi:DNA helicase-2/ATP-dependent DNA helicase PcrA